MAAFDSFDVEILFKLAVISMFERLITLGKQFSLVSLPLKMLISALVGILAGPGLLGFLSEYATYSYAIYYGVRPPLEGIPYLKAAVTLVAFLLMLIGFFGYGVGLFLAWLTALGFRRILDQASFIEPRVKATTLAFLRNLSSRNLLIFALLVGVAFLSAYLGSGYLLAGPRDFRGACFSLGVGFAGPLLLAQPRVAWAAAGVIALIYMGWALTFMFNAPEYAKFLRYVGYGGGIHVMIEMKEAEGGVLPRTQKSYSGALLLRTTHVVMLYDSGSVVTREIPIGEIKSIVLPAKSLHHLPYTLPLSSDALSIRLSEAAVRPSKGNTGR